MRRLEVMLKERETYEAVMQRVYGDRPSRSIRSVRWREAEALRAAITALREAFGDEK